MKLPTKKASYRSASWRILALRSFFLSEWLRQKQIREDAWLTAEEAANVDWKQFHRIAGPRDENGKRQMFYVVSKDDNDDWLTEEEAASFDWKKLHRVVSSRDEYDKRRMCYEIPDTNSDDRMLV